MQAGSTLEAEYELVAKSKELRSGKLTVEFGEQNEVQRPKLKWFQHDDIIKNLIEMRCQGNNKIKSERLVQNKQEINMERQAVKENRSELIFEVEF